MKLIIETDVMATMRDGVKLAADIYRPDDNKRYPVLLSRLPYNKTYSFDFMRPHVLASQGYIVILQDVRGRYASEGVFEGPYIAEQTDGYDTVEWAATLPYSDGKVGMLGLSYFGYTQMLAAMTQPPHLTAIAPTMSQNSFTEVSQDHNGATELSMWQTWSLESIAANLLERTYTDPKELATKRLILQNNITNIPYTYDSYPYEQWQPITSLFPDFYLFDMYRKPLTDPFWDKITVKNQYEKVKTPGLHIAGWYDCFLKGTLENFKNGQQKGLGDQLIIGPWVHGDFSARSGELYYGEQARAELYRWHLEWFNHLLKGLPLIDSTPVRYFTMGTNEWHSATTWPPANTKEKRYYLNRRELVLERSASESSLSYEHDPKSPVRTRGGVTFMHGLEVEGPKEQLPITSLKDTLSFETEALKEPLNVTGNVRVLLEVSTDATSVDFTAKLSDVYPDGTAYNLTDDIVRIKHVNKNERFTIEIELWGTSNVFLEGHRLRLDIASSNFPRFDVNPGTGGSFFDSTETVVSKQTVYVGGNNISQVILPIVTF
ncbi:CocE/NonD family hydrolase [Brochothrix thermosphacta]|uniref:CocE/NonD family hydrolase n=1 Tax=Brochothrix thermosphacta TaxID=2756 RepID=UPI000D7B9218|nr:CocE/NonD family hydrolase [Brochothrix thermosphacta]SPN74262.1 putative esterase [Brochothrix thermosphacta]